MTRLLKVAGSTCAIIHEGGQFALLDSHARDADGLVNHRGKSVVVYFPSVNDVFHHIWGLSRMLRRGTNQFEIAGVRASITGSLVDSGLSSGSSPVLESRNVAFGASLSEKTFVDLTLGCKK